MMETEPIETFLCELGMEDEIDAFKRESLDLKLFKELTESELHDVWNQMKLNIGKKMKLNKAIAKMKSSK